MNSSCSKRPIFPNEGVSVEPIAMNGTRPNPTDVPVLIVGGGIAGLTAARRLHQAGIAFLLLESRERLGGRILTVDATEQPSVDGFDLGPSWFWPEVQPEIRDLVRELNIPFFPQNSEGDVVFHRMSREAPQRYRGAPQEQQSMRLAGGTGSIVKALISELPENAIRLGATVTKVAIQELGIDVVYQENGRDEHTLSARYVIFALPPRLLEMTVSFTPALDPQVARRWRETPTWMAPHAKVFAIYDRPFWREAGLSGTAQSMAGPLVEIHDATTASGKAALFGFVGIPADGRSSMGRDAIVAASLEQFALLFGPQARTPVATLFKDWSDDPLTATTTDRQAGGHLAPSDQPWITGEWAGRVSLAGSECSLTEPGYLTGAVEAAQRAVADVVRHLALS